MLIKSSARALCTLTTQLFISGLDLIWTLGLYNCLLDPSTWMSGWHLTLAKSVSEFSITTMPLNGPSILLVAQAKPWGTLCSSPLTAHIQSTMEAYRLYLQIHTESDYFSLLLLYHAAETAPSLDCRRASKPAPCVLLAPLQPILNTAAPGNLLKSISDHVTLVLKSLPCTTFQQERAVAHRTLCNLLPIRSLRPLDSLLCSHTGPLARS